MSFGYAFIWVDDVPATVAFFEQAFGLTRRMLQDDRERGWYAEMETGPTTLAIADTREAQMLFPAGFRANHANALPGAFQISIVTPDVAGAYARAIAAGASAQQEPQAMPWGQTIARVRDPNGIFVSIATPRP